MFVPRGHNGPLQLSQIRRPVFPSWTWAGWKTCRVNHSRFGPDPLFDSRTKLYVEYELEAASSTSSPCFARAPKATKWKRLDWEQENQEILELARKGAYKMPARLVIRRTVLDMRLKWHDWYKSSGNWTVTSPEFWEGRQVYVPRTSLEDMEPGGRGSKDGEVQALALILAVWPYGVTSWSDVDVSLAALLLRPLASRLNGPSDQMYEHVSKIWSRPLSKEEYKPEWTPLSKLLREMEVTLV